MTANEPDPAGISGKEAAIAFLRLAASGKAREAMTAMEDNAARNPVSDEKCMIHRVESRARRGFV
jgi:hypothetical protein